MRKMIFVVASLGLSACASTPQVRGLADKTGVFVSSLQSGTSGFIEKQNRLNALNAQRLDKLAADGNQDRANVRQQRLAWTDAGDTTRLATHDAANRRTAEVIVGSLETKATASARLGSGPAEAYAATQKALAEVATKPKTGVALRELITFGQAIFEKYNELEEAAKEDAESTDEAAEAADASAAAGAATTPK